MHVGGPRSWLCLQTMHLENLGAVCAAEYEHNLARYTRTHLSLSLFSSLSLSLSVCLSLGWPYEPWTLWVPIRPHGPCGEARSGRPSVPILCPIRLILSKVPRLGSSRLYGARTYRQILRKLCDVALYRAAISAVKTAFSRRSSSSDGAKASQTSPYQL